MIADHRPPDRRLTSSEMALRMTLVVFAAAITIASFWIMVIWPLAVVAWIAVGVAMYVQQRTRRPVGERLAEGSSAERDDLADRRAKRAVERHAQHGA